MVRPLYILVTIILWITVPGILVAQEKEMPDLSLKYLKKSDGSVYLEGHLSLFNEEEIPLQDQYVQFFTGIDSLQEVGAMYTGANGKAGISIPEGFSVPVNEEGFFKYYARFEGNDSLEMAEAEVEYKDVNLEMRLEEIDSVKTVLLKAYEFAGSGDTVPVPDEDVYLFVTRMFSNLSIAEDWLNGEGELVIEFPDDLPGDSTGMVTILAMFQDHGVYGNVEQRQTIQWGQPSDITLSESYRALWTQYAPTWMVVTLSILLTGVWSHYLFVIIKLFQIKRERKKTKNSIRDFSRA